jgi:hypothetical protein
MHRIEEEERRPASPRGASFSDAIPEPEKSVQGRTYAALVSIQGLRYYAVFALEKSPEY